MSSCAEPGVGRLAALEGIGRGASLQIQGDERLAILDLRLQSGRQWLGPPAGPDEDAVRRAGRQQQHGVGESGRREQRLPGRHPDERDPEPVGHPLRRGEADAQTRERPRTGADDDPRQS